MKEIVVMSGKGGTGKTSIAAAIGVLAGKQAVVADCDVDAANLHLLYNPEKKEENEFWSGKTAVIDYDKCIDCGVCEEICRFDAISQVNVKYEIDEISCEGCSACYYLCPTKAIAMNDNKAGYWFKSKSRFGNLFVHAKLGIGQENSGKLVSKVKEESEKLAEDQNIPYVIVDGPPGIGCPAISSFSGASNILIVTEAAQSGYHDLKRLVELVDYFKVKATCIINKFDLNHEVNNEIEEFCNNHAIAVINKIPYHSIFIDALQEGKTVIETNEQSIKNKIEEIWNHLKKME